MQPGECQFHLGLNAGDACYLAPGRVLGQVLKERCLARARVAVQDQGPALAGAKVIEERVQRGALYPAVDQLHGSFLELSQFIAHFTNVIPGYLRRRQIAGWPEGDAPLRGDIPSVP
jgi:hypothetical protein